MSETMHVINVEFRRMTDWSIPELLGEMGVYVLWDGYAKRRPTYVGEGKILERLLSHHGRWRPPFDGYAAVLSEKGRSPQRAKADGTIVEAMLLEVAASTDRMPSVNVARGQLRSLIEVFKRHGTVRINVRGLDPLQPPAEQPRLAGARSIVLRDQGLTLEHGWRSRRRGRT